MRSRKARNSSGGVFAEGEAEQGRFMAQVGCASSCGSRQAARRRRPGQASVPGGAATPEPFQARCVSASARHRRRRASQPGVQLGGVRVVVLR